MTTTTIRIIVALALGAGLFVFAFFAPRASGAEPGRAGPVWQMWKAEPNKDWEPVRDRSGGVWSFTSGSACSVDIVSVARGLPDGSMVACRRFDVKAVTR